MSAAWRLLSYLTKIGTEWARHNVGVDSWQTMIIMGSSRMTLKYKCEWRHTAENTRITVTNKVGMVIVASRNFYENAKKNPWLLWLLFANLLLVRRVCFSFSMRDSFFIGCSAWGDATSRINAMRRRISSFNRTASTEEHGHKFQWRVRDSEKHHDMSIWSPENISILHLNLFWAFLGRISSKIVKCNAEIIEFCWCSEWLRENFCYSHSWFT